MTFMAGLLAAEEPLVDWGYVGDHLDEVREMAVEHVKLTVLAVAIGFAIAMVMALLSLRWRWSYAVLAGFCGVLYAIPSVALFGILIFIAMVIVKPAGTLSVTYALEQAASQPAVQPPPILGDRLGQLAAARDAGYITPQEHDRKRSELLAQF